MTSCRYTPRQLEALAWLPEDGAWREPSTSDPYFLWANTGLVECKFPPSLWQPCRLTPSGITERARLVAEGKIK